MPTVVFQHRVGDFNTWIAGHEDRVRIFSPVCTGFRTFQDANDPNSVTLVMEVTDMEKLEEIMKDPRTDEAKKVHTVKEPVYVSFEVSV